MEYRDINTDGAGSNDTGKKSPSSSLVVLRVNFYNETTRYVRYKLTTLAGKKNHNFSLKFSVDLNLGRSKVHRADRRSVQHGYAQQASQHGYPRSYGASDPA